MSLAVHRKSNAATKTLFTPVHTGLLQRKCACGGPAGAAAECEECGEKKLSFQRSAHDSEVEPRKSAGVPAIVHQALRSPGQQLDPETRAFMEPRFGHDFSNVRVHTDQEAAASARGVNALAYTLEENIVFDSGSYAPTTRPGRLLLAHELTHVVQQRTGLRRTSDARLQKGVPDQTELLVGAAGGPYEQEADRVARSVVEDGTHARPSLVSADRVSPFIQRQQPPAQPAAPVAPVAPVAPSQAQQLAIEAARATAAIRTQIALLRLRGIVPAGPPGRPDPSQQMRERAIRLARVMFDWANPNMDQIEEIVGSMVSKLTNPQVMVAGIGDPECGTRAAYVRGLQPPIVLCSTFFTDPPEEQARTMIHEAAHLARIGSAGLGESYCVFFECATSCGGFDSADSWAHFIHCLSGQTPDQPPVVQGQQPGQGPPANPAQPPGVGH